MSSGSAGAPLPRSEKWPWRELLIVAGVGVLGMVGNQIFFVVGIGRTSVAHASLVIAFTPVLVLLLAWLRRQERLTRLKAAGMALAVAGVAVLNLSPGRSARGASLLGRFPGRSCAPSRSPFTPSSPRSGCGSYGSVPINTLGYAVSTLLLITPVWTLGRDFHFASVPAIAWLDAGLHGGSFVGAVLHDLQLCAGPPSRLARVVVQLCPAADRLAGGLVAVGRAGDRAPSPSAARMVLAGVWLTSRN